MNISNERAGPLTRVLPAGVLLFVLVFAAGFAFGAVRELLVRPYTGRELAQLLELPLMIAVSYMASRFVVRRSTIGEAGDWRDVGLLAFVLLMIGEMLVALLILRMGLKAFIGSFLTPVGFLSLLAQALLIVLPEIAARREKARFHGS
jgi:hypothetical protein